MAEDDGEARVEIVDRARVRIGRAFLDRVVREALCEGARENVDVTVLLTDDEEISRLHGEHLGRSESTDVMSFDLGDSIEVAVNVECARREAERSGHAVRAEVALYVVHGILHACGHDDREARRRARMRAAERRVMNALRLEYAPVDGAVEEGDPRDA